MYQCTPTSALYSVQNVFYFFTLIRDVTGTKSKRKHQTSKAWKFFRKEKPPAVVKSELDECSAG